MCRKANSAIASVAITAALWGNGLAQDPAPAPAPTPDPSAPELSPVDLPDDQLEAGLVSGHPIGLPSPPELLLILSKQGNPKWRKLYHPALQGQDSDRAKTALRLGLSITEGHLATMARDAQKIRDVTADLQLYAKALGISGGLAETARSINALAEAKAWAYTAYELEALTTQSRQLLETQRDPELANLISSGLWIRLLQISTSIVTEKDFEDTSIAISSHWTLCQISHLLEPKDSAQAPTLKTIRDQVAKLERVWNPTKLLTGHKFDDALIEESHQRLSNAVNLFAK